MRLGCDQKGYFIEAATCVRLQKMFIVHFENKISIDMCFDNKIADTVALRPHFHCDWKWDESSEKLW